MKSYLKIRPSVPAVKWTIVIHKMFFGRGAYSAGAYIKHFMFIYNPDCQTLILFRHVFFNQ